MPDTDSIQSGFLEQLIKDNDIVPSREYAFPSDSLFEILKKQPQKQAPVIKSVFTGHVLQAKESVSKQPYLKNTYPDWILFSVLFCFALFTYTRYKNKKRINQIFKAVVANRYINQLLREGYVLIGQTSLPLSILFIITSSFFTYYLTAIYNPLLPFSLKAFSYIFVIILSFYLLKIIIIKTIGFIFDNADNSYEHLLLIFLYNQIAGIVLTPIIVILYYTQFPWTDLLITFTIILTILIFIYKIIRLSLLNASKSRYSFFYLFLYLCTIEILPILLVAKYLINNYTVI